jgi:mRNA-degrading endonuclease toxin of MazEF toxin-antitoxin module
VSSNRAPRLGSVAWAELVDANGFGKVRPVVIVTPTAEIAPGKTVRVVAITTRLPVPLPEDHVVLPWDRQGKARSGLRRRCAAVASWQAEILVEDVQQVVGILSPTVIGELLAKIAATLPAPKAAPSAGSGDPGAGDTEEAEQAE